MAKIEYGEGILRSFDRDKMTLRFCEIQRGVRTTFAGEIPKSPREFELPYGIEFEVGFTDEDLKKFLGNIVKYILSDGYVVNIEQET